MLIRENENEENRREVLILRRQYAMILHEMAIIFGE